MYVYIHKGATNAYSYMVNVDTSLIEVVNSF